VHRYACLPCRMARLRSFPHAPIAAPEASASVVRTVAAPEYNGSAQSPRSFGRLSG
jgi:hypothetical protein